MRNSVHYSQVSQMSKFRQRTSTAPDNISLSDRDVIAGRSPSTSASAYIHISIVLTLAGKALYVEVVGLDSQHLSLAWLSTSETLDDLLPRWRTRMAAPWSMKHCRERRGRK